MVKAGYQPKGASGYFEVAKEAEEKFGANYQVTRNQLELFLQMQFLEILKQLVETIDDILDIGRIAISAEMLGNAEAAFDTTLDYLKQRKQFGVLIGSFQALQHRAAEMFCEIELTKSSVMAAMRAADERSNDLQRLSSLAKTVSGETLHLVSNEAIQMHGGIGVTDEYDIGFFLKRARVAEQIFGSSKFHTERYANLSGF